MEQYCSIWRTTGLQSSCWRGCEERRAEMCSIAGWAVPTHPQFSGDLVRGGCMRRQDLAGKVRALAALASRRSNSSLLLLFPTFSPYFLPSVSSREAGRRGEVPRGSNFLPISSRRPPVFSRVKHQPGAPWQRSAPNRARRTPNRARWMPYACRAR